MSEWRKIWTNGLPNEGRSPKSGHRMAAEGMQFPWRWNGGTIFLNVGVIWEMSDEDPPTRIRSLCDERSMIARQPKTPRLDSGCLA